MKIQHALLAIASTLLYSLSASADDELWNAHFQSTYVWQQKPAFDARYSGSNSLQTESEISYSFTATAAFGLRLWSGAEIYFDPEVAQGVPFSNLTGLGGFSNGEMSRTSGPDLSYYRARAFLRQTWNLGGNLEATASAANQLGGMLDRRRLVITVGNLSVLDVFDDNRFSHDPRTQFLNWSLMTYGAYDYAGDARGYSRGLVAELFYDEWAVRGGRFLMPNESNGLPLNPHIFESYGDQIEITHAHQWANQPGKVRVLAYRNVAHMGAFADANEYASDTGGVPDLAAVRGHQAKYGFGFNFEQNCTDDLGTFARVSWANGEQETFAFAEIDRSIAAGISLRGSTWQRSADTLGVAFAANALSSSHRRYLADGGHGFFLGDGRLNYRPEAIAEIYYSFVVRDGVSLSLDWQHIDNPGYNADRGPASFFGGRVHLEF